MLDDCGHQLTVRRPASRVVSLVPSLTEALASVAPSSLVAATEWCTHPHDLEVPRIRGTKNPDTRAIIAMRPDIVIANQEENRAIDVERLRTAGIQVWVTRIETIDEALDSLERLFAEALGWPVPDWLAEARTQWTGPPAMSGVRVIVPIWRDPWMVVGARTFTASLLRRLGCVVLPHDAGDRYPVVEGQFLDALDADVVLLPDEPYAFSEVDGPEAFASTPTALVSGRMLTWYGPSLVPARSYLEELLRR